MARRYKYKVVVTGVPELDRVLRELLPKVANKVARQALRVGAKAFAARARELAPAETGKMEGAIKVRAASRSRKAIRVGVVIAAEPFVDPSRPKYPFYPAAQEFGTSEYAGRPYLRPAFQELKGHVEARVIREIWAGVERAAAGG